MLLIALLLTIVAPVIQIYFSVLKIQGKTKITLLTTTMLAFGVGIILSITSFFVAIYNWPAGVKCVTGAVGLPVFGIMVTITFVPLISVISCIILIRKIRIADHNKILLVNQSK